MRTALAGLGLLAAAVFALVHAGAPNAARWHLILWLGLTFAAFAVAMLALWRAPRRLAGPLVLGGAVLLQLVAMSVPPQTTDDFYRYLWDGRVQAAGIDPYRYAPPDPALARLRDPYLFPLSCRDRVCTRMNHPTDHTIYPPVAEGGFVLVHALSPGGSRWKPLQLAAAALSVLTTASVLRVMRRARRNPRWAAVYAWFPLTVWETGNNAHVDVLGVLLTVIGLGLAASGRPARAGVALAAAVAVKILPVLVFPSVLRRAPARIGLAAAATIGLVYLPHVLAVGTHVFGFLPGYLQEEGYSGAKRWALLRLLLPDAVAPFVGVALLAGIAGWAALRSDERQPWDSAVVLTGAAFLLAGPPYPWYLELLVVLAALSRRPEWLGVAAAAYLVYFAPSLHINPVSTQRWAYGAAVVALIAVTLLRQVGGGGGAGRAVPAIR